MAKTKMMLIFGTMITAMSASPLHAIPTGMFRSPSEKAERWRKPEPALEIPPTRTSQDSRLTWNTEPPCPLHKTWVTRSLSQLTTTLLSTLSTWPTSTSQTTVSWQPVSASQPMLTSRPARTSAMPSVSATTTWSAQPSNTSGPAGTGLGDIYTLYSGDGTAAEGWPPQSSWVDFDTMWANNQVLIATSCSIWGLTDNSADEIQDILRAIDIVSSATGVDARFILAVVMQESKGCVRVPTTFGSVANPGLMQDFDGSGTCNSDGVIQDPCPASEILQMIQGGTAGTASGPGLAQDLVPADASDVSGYYKAARIYNSGSIPADGNLVGAGATPCYASDIANRLTGWVVAESECCLY